MQRIRILFAWLTLVSLLTGGCIPSSGGLSSPSSTTVKASVSPSPVEPPAFIDIAESAGIHYRWEIEGPHPCNILQTIGNGCAFLDYNNDSNLDIFLVGKHLALYRGDGKGHFTDVTRSLGLTSFSGHFLGCAVGDIDNDGWSDIYVSAHQGGILLHNQKGQTFQEMTKSAGLTPQPWGSSCTFLDADGDRLLDLYIGNYVQFGPKTDPQLCKSHSYMTSCGPGYYSAARGVLYRNLGRGRFRDVTREWKLDAVTGKALGVAAAPFEHGKHPTLAIANDQVPSDLIPLNGVSSTNRGVESGMAYASDGSAYGGMGIDWGDYDDDGSLDLVIATYQNQAKCVFRSNEGLFAMQDTAALGMLSSVSYVAFGVKWLDYDNDGWLDLMFANGHVQDNIADVEILNPGSSGALFRQPTVLYRNQNGKRFVDMSALLQGGAERLIVGRGLATGDYDNDGKVDVLIADSDGQPLLLHNVTPKTGTWLLIDLVGTRSNRDAYGAIVTVEVEGRKWIRHCHADGSYLSSSDKRIHFGLAQAITATVKVQWPSGIVNTYRNVKCNQVLRLTET